MTPRDHENRLLALEQAYRSLAREFEGMKAKVDAPVDATRLTLSAKQVAAIVAVCCGLMGGLWSMNYQLQDLKTNQQMTRTKVEGLERSVATLLGRTDKESK